MSKFLVMSVLAFASVSQARISAYTGKVKTPNSNYKQMYLVDGSKADEVEAFQAAISGKEVYKCTIQKIGMNKGGTGASMKNEAKSE